jgi:hypothetical protein
VLGDTDAVATDEARTALLRLLPGDEDAAVSLKELEAATDANRATLQRALKLVTGIQSIGKGKRGDPHRYFLPVMVSAQTSISEGNHGQKQGQCADVDEHGRTGERACI